ncbi:MULTISPECIES: hypothetical protein [unclassified Fusibacter]|uniref:hypothetical protein n=1 Tax=unclassified Fusibacter TaxID=2624464 RepID=UPI0010113E4D|nr:MULTISPECIES: hypothetical protein [unclassified Fusibacter]MCK8060798.1 hypothetical protein [Fusibacter sp. A2]NPE23094.1 hypothetical protein [Fusibacter sp. A1]RXV59765.1 hypothetical protein DWB64_14775 [Fusibacter sp. A1]
MNKKILLVTVSVFLLLLLFIGSKFLLSTDEHDVVFRSDLKENKSFYASYDKIVRTIEEAAIESYAVVTATLDKVEPFDADTYEYYFTLHDYIAGNEIDQQFMIFSYDLELVPGTQYCMFLNEEYTGNTPAPNYSIAYDIIYTLEDKKNVEAYSDIPINDLLDYYNLSMLSKFEDKVIRRDHKYKIQKHIDLDAAIEAASFKMKVSVGELARSNKYNYFYEYEIIETYSEKNSVVKYLVSGKKLEKGIEYFVLLDSGSVAVDKEFGILETDEYEEYQIDKIRNFK